MENINFYKQINLFLENKRLTKPSACVCKQGPAYTCLMHTYTSMDLRTQLGFQKIMKDKFFALKTEVWNESHIIWEPFQTLIFQLYRALHGIFRKHTENPKGKPKIH